MVRRKSKRQEPPGPCGFLVVDKPVGWTSHDVVEAARRWFGTRRVGHLGTLDPLATGVLPLAIREATKLIPYLPEAVKKYSGTIKLGVSTDTFDAEGREVGRYDGPFPDETTVKDALLQFVGEIMQTPPLYSAVKYGGEPLYKLARRGESVEPPSRKVNIRQIVLKAYDPPDLGISVTCGPGTYVRAIANDLGQVLNCGAHLADLRREESGPFRIEMAWVPDLLDSKEPSQLAECLISPHEALEISMIELPDEKVRLIRNGNRIYEPTVTLGIRRPGQRFMAGDLKGQLVGLLELRPDKNLHPLRVFPAD